MVKYNPKSDTSREAAESIEAAGGISSLQSMVYSHLLKTPSTDEEMQDALGMNPNTQRPRRIELVEKKLVRDSGARRLTRSGCRAIVWETTDRPDKTPKQTSILDRLRLLTGGVK